MITRIPSNVWQTTCKITHGECLAVRLKVADTLFYIGNYFSVVDQENLLSVHGLTERSWWERSSSSMQACSLSCISLRVSDRRARSSSKTKESKSIESSGSLRKDSLLEDGQLKELNEGVDVGDLAKHRTQKANGEQATTNRRKVQ